MKVYYTCRERGPAYRLDAELYEFADGVVELAKEDVEYTSMRRTSTTMRSN